MRVINGYFRLVAFLAMFLAIWAPIVQIGAEVFTWWQNGAMANFDLYGLFPTETAALIETHRGTTLGIALDLFCDMWVWVPAVLLLAAIGIVHWIFASLTSRG